MGGLIILIGIIGGLISLFGGLICLIGGLIGLIGGLVGLIGCIIGLVHPVYPVHTVYPFLLLQQTAVQSSTLFLSRTVDRILQTCRVVKKSTPQAAAI